jgi:hypothetical protein
LLLIQDYASSAEPLTLSIGDRLQSRGTGRFRKIEVDSCQPRFIVIWARKKRKPKVSVSRQTAAYDLQLVREILNAPVPKVEWRRRQKGKNDYRRLGLEIEDVYSILRGLRPRDFQKRSIFEKDPAQPVADVYHKHVRLPQCGDLRLYIKFFIEGSSLLVMISFHPDGE